jgi:hypothetical protein
MGSVYLQDVGVTGPHQTALADMSKERSRAGGACLATCQIESTFWLRDSLCLSFEGVVLRRGLFSYRVNCRYQLFHTLATAHVDHSFSSISKFPTF